MSSLQRFVYLSVFLRLLVVLHMIHLIAPFCASALTPEYQELWDEISKVEPVETLSRLEIDNLITDKRHLKRQQPQPQPSSSSIFSSFTSSTRSCPHPPNFPTTIPIEMRVYKNWAENIQISGLWTATPRTYKDILIIANWAFLNDFMVRPKGFANSWAPLTVTGKGSTCYNTILVDTTQFLVQMKMLSSKGSFRAVQVQTGATIESLLSFLEDHRCGLFAAPVSGELTVGGVLALSGHGSGAGALSKSSMATNGQHLPPDGYSSGSLSNLILSFKAIVWDHDKDYYVIRKFSRTERDARVFVAHMGRAFITQVTLLVGPAYKLRCQTLTTLSAQNLLAYDPEEKGDGDMDEDDDDFGPGEGGGEYSSSNKNPNNMGNVDDDDDFDDADDELYSGSKDDSVNESDTFAKLVDKYHSVDLSVFPYTDQTVLMACSNKSRYASAKDISAPYPFSYLENLPSTVRILLNQLFSGRHYLAPMISRLYHQFNSAGLRYSNNEDIIGPSKNILLRYNSRQSSAHSYSSGYAIITNRQSLQKISSEVYTYYRSLLEKFSDDWKYPQNEPLQLTVTGLDDPKHLPPLGKFDPPALSTLTPVRKKKKKWDVALLISINVYPGTQHYNKFMRELESFLFLTYDGEGDGLVRPEWATAWAFTDDGAWENHIMLKKVIPKAFGNDWDWAVKRLNYYDPHYIFSNDFLNYMHQLNNTAPSTSSAVTTPVVTTSTSNKRHTFFSFFTAS